MDNASDEKQVKTINTLFQNHSKISIILNRENIGFTRATNQIITDYLLPKDFKYIAMINNDAFPNQDWLEKLVANAEETNADMVSSRLINHDIPYLIDNTGHFMLNTGEVIPEGFGTHINKHTKRRETAGACAGAALFRMSMIRRIGVFDDYFVTGYEDAEYGIRALITGHKLMYEPEAIAYHKMSASVNKIRSEEYMVKIQSSIFYTYLKLMPLPVIILNLPFIIGRTTVLFILFIVFRRFGYLRIYKKALKNLVSNDFRKIKQKRKAFYKSQDVKNSFYIMYRQRFFLWDNIRRFFLYFVKGERTIFEKTNN